jgi:hypothetical protein
VKDTGIHSICASGCAFYIRAAGVHYDEHYMVLSDDNHRKYSADTRILEFFNKEAFWFLRKVVLWGPWGFLLCDW